MSILLLLPLLALCDSQAQNSLHYKLTEGKWNNKLEIFDLIDATGLKDQYPPGILQQFKFTFLSQPIKNISLDAPMGKLFIDGDIDREAICPGQSLCLANFDIAVQPPAYFQVIKVTIEVEDVNDNAPSFPESEIDLSILETASTDTGFVLPSAVDNDSPRYGIQRYELESTEKKPKFAIKVNKNLDGSMDVRLMLVRRLDRENSPHHTVTVRAYDGGPKRNVGKMVVKINVVDTNDNEPVFKQSEYDVSVFENVNTPGGGDDVIVTVEAEDSDAGPNGRVRYSFSRNTQEKHGHIFGIREHTGEVFVKSTLDHEASDIHHLIVVARDFGEGSMPSDATVVVRVLDVNDNRPEITITTLTEPGTNRAQIMENSPPGTFVAHIRVIDLDSGENGRFDCTLGDRDFSLVRRFSTEYQILTNRTLDREQKSSYSLAVVCKDHGRDQQIGIEHLYVSVLDQNDNYPLFTQQTYTASLVENNQIHRLVLQVNATDADTGDNGRIMYALDNSRDAKFFEIDGDGKIRARKSLDREARRRFQFKVHANDRGSPRKTSAALVVIAIEDVNDEAPEFSKRVYNFRVRENMPALQLVGTVSAIDNDSAPYDRFKYSLVPNRRTNEFFEIEPTSGKILTKKQLDRELYPSHVFVVRAIDDNKRELTSTASVSVIVEDVNDNPPVFDFPSIYNHTLSISNKVPIGSTIITLTAHDDDQGENARLIYTITGEDIGDSFLLDPYNGILTLNTRIGHITENTFTILLEVRDHGVIPQMARGVLHVTVNQSIPFTIGQSQSESILNTHNVILVVSFIIAVLIIVSVVVLTVCLVRRKARKGRRKTETKHYRMQALKETGNGSSIPTAPLNGAPKKHGYTSVPDKQLSPRQRTKSIETVFSATVPAEGESECQTKAIYSVPDKSRAHSSLRHQPQDNGKDIDQSSQHSGDGSNTDSGRGASEEGDALHHIRARNLHNPVNLPQPTISGVRPLPPCPPPPPARAITSNYGEGYHGYQPHPPPRLHTFAPAASSTLPHVKLAQVTPAKHHVTFQKTPQELSAHIYSNVPKPNSQSGVATLPNRATKKMESMIV